MGISTLPGAPQEFDGSNDPLEAQDINRAPFGGERRDAQLGYDAPCGKAAVLIRAVC
jgi:hypothetical protein